MFNKIKDYYDRGLWTAGMVMNLVGKVITPEEYEAITGSSYVGG